FPPRKDHEKAEFEVHEVYAVDVLVSSGEGKVSPIPKKSGNAQPGALQMLGGALRCAPRCAQVCCPLRALEDEKKARMGVVECAKHELLQPFNVLYEKEGE
ncbi:PA2G4 protein, partial [Rhadina sibilatrix]|nr:PA2G4 protein [Rhadina sibilatrix]